MTSGSSCSERVVKPLRSANRTVTVRRSASPVKAGMVGAGATGAGRNGSGEAEGDGGGAAGSASIGWDVAPCFCPHFGQNAKSGGQAQPQRAQRAGWRAPHFGQNANSA